MKNTFVISDGIHFGNIREIIANGLGITLSEKSEKQIAHCRTFLDSYLEKSENPVYGINTGFGSLCNVRISNDDLSRLQENLIKSHACGFGEEVPSEIVRLMIILKAQSLSYGRSGVAVATVKRLLDLYNNDIIPVVYQQGSLGASGDLAPLAHLCLPLIGMGEVYYKGEKIPSGQALKSAGLDTISLSSKEGLALLNGTQFMSSYGTWLVMHAQKLSLWADIIAAASIDAFDGRIDPFHHLIQEIRPHNGQITTARIIRETLAGSEIIAGKKEHVQDPYSFRCVPQVHGASRDAIQYVSEVILREINSVTDNPTVFPDEAMIVSAGNFHGQPLALALDFLSIAVAEIGNISERRTYQLIGGKRGLPNYLVATPGLNSGFMIPQYTAASIVSQSKQFATPASVDSIESSQGQEDHVSMGANAATKAYRIYCNTERVLAIELLTAMQALEFRHPKKSSPKIERLFNDFRLEIPFVSEDRYMSELMHKSLEFIKNHDPEKF